MESEKEPMLSLLVSSCDRFEDLWDPFFTLFFRYWPDCPFPVYLMSNQLSYPDPRVTTLAVGNAGSWATECRRALNGIESKYVLFIMEDNLLDRPVNTQRIRSLTAYVERTGAGYLGLWAIPAPSALCEDCPAVGEIRPGTEYRVTLQAAIWNKAVLDGLLQDGESPWEMERCGSIRSNELAVPFLALARDPDTNQIIDPPVAYLEACVLGRWQRGAVAHCRKEKIAIDLARRPVESHLRRSVRYIMPRLPEGLRGLLLANKTVKTTAKKALGF